MPVVNTTNSFSNNEQITSGKLNNIMDNSFFVTDAVVPSGGLQVTAGGQMQIGDNANGVTTAKIADLNVTTAKIADGAVTPAKLSAAGPYWDSAGGTFLFSQRVLEVGYGITSNTDSVIDFHAVHPLTDYEARIIRSSGDNGTFSISNNGTGAITLSASGGVTFGTANMPTPSGTAPVFGCRAWVNFNGQANSDLGGTYDRNSSTSVTITATAHGLIAGSRVFLDFTVGTGTAPFDGIYEVASSPAPTANTFSVTSNVITNSTGTVLLKRKTIRGSGNVSCVSAAQSSPPTSPPTSNQTVDNGYYIINFSTAMPNSNFSIAGIVSESGTLTAVSGNEILGGFGFNEKCAYVTTINVASAATDCLYNNVMVIG